MIVQLAKSEGIDENAARQKIIDFIASSPAFPSAGPAGHKKLQSWWPSLRPIVPLLFMEVTTRLMGNDSYHLIALRPVGSEADVNNRNRGTG